jgi:hypothetical protein
MSQRIRRGVLVVVVIAAVVIVGLVALPGIRNVTAGATGIHDAASLPDHVRVCGRGWTKDVLLRRSSLAEIRARDGVEPVFIDPGWFPSCAPGACTTAAQDGPCATVVYVRVGEDAYLDYSLQGGP